MFERPHHQRIGRILEALDAPLLEGHGCLFGGGTAVALRYGEYRESVDVDFLISNLEGYRNLRHRMTTSTGLDGIARVPHGLTQVREVRADQYGIRTMVLVDGSTIKFEIVLEARMPLEAPGPADRICGVATLTRLDMAASKLLANSDRWGDDGTFSRDLLDLAMMELDEDLLRQAVAKAALAYGASIEADLLKAIERLGSREHRLERCMEAMRVSVPRAVVWERIVALQTLLRP